MLGNYIGLDTTGTVAIANGDGVYIANKNNIVGGSSPGARNVISGNRGTGINVSPDLGVPATGNKILGNYIGVDASGHTALGNLSGVTLVSGANLVSGNVISGNFDWLNAYAVGIAIAVPGNRVVGNPIGTDAVGATAVGNNIGVFVGGSGSVIGDDSRRAQPDLRQREPRYLGGFLRDRDEGLRRSSAPMRRAAPPYGNEAGV